MDTKDPSQERLHAPAGSAGWRRRSRGRVLSDSWAGKQCSTNRRFTYSNKQ